MSTQIGQLSHLAVGKETTAGTAVTPSTFIPYNSESISINQNYQQDNPIVGNRYSVYEVTEGKRQIEGDVELEVERKTFGHILNNTFSLSTAGAGSPYTHTCVIGTPASYTYEIRKGQAGFRYYGVQVDKLSFGWDDNKLIATTSIKARGAFTVATVSSASGTSIDLDTEYDSSPVSGLVVGDTLVLDNGTTTETVSITALTDADTVAVSTISGSFTAGDRVYLSPLTPSYTVTSPFTFSETQVCFGVDAATALSATHTGIDDISWGYMNNLDAINRTGSQNPAELIQKFCSSELSMKKAFEDTRDYQKFLDLEKEAVVIRSYGPIFTGSTKAELRCTFNNAKAIEAKCDVKAEDIIIYNRTHAPQYDTSDGQALDIKLVNDIASYG